ncbi:MAG: Organic solvent tolerance protein OstA, partial [Cyclobacteriaceae bacterium]|nr:Organic solvent tolerance protein OstA [Cyclobacteriaceae bacterium]
MINKSANYFNGGKIIDATKTLESEKGNYDTEGKMMIFTDSVKMTTPDYTLKSENLVYNMITKRARISGDQTITTSDGIVLQSKKGGEFDTEKGTSVFRVGEVDTDKYLLKGDELYFDNRLGSYSATGNVYLLAKEDSVIITGNNAHFWNDKGLAKVFGDPLLKKPLINDTLFLRADTLVSIDDSLSANKRLLAYNNVMIFKTDLQGRSDSLAYFLSDSSITFYQDPILWNDGSQITADTISVVLKNGTIDQLQTSVDSFIISEDS